MTIAKRITVLIVYITAANVHAGFAYIFADSVHQITGAVLFVKILG
jgi:hypothetical protein